MRFSTITLGLAATVQGAVLQARDSGCTVHLEPTRSPPSAPGEIILYGSLTRWNTATAGGANSKWVDYSHSLSAPYSFKYKANMIPGYATNDQIMAIIAEWPGSWLSGQDKPRENDFRITAVSCS